MATGREVYMSGRKSNDVAFNNTTLQNALKAARRITFVGGAKQPQCYACIIKVGPAVANIVSGVKDGITSVHDIPIVLEEPATECELCIPNLNDVIGALKTHGDIVYLSHKPNGNLLIYSNKRQTTFMSSPLAKAYPSSRNSIIKQHQDAVEIATRFDLEMAIYTDTKGKKHSPVCIINLERDILVDALSVANLNGQNESTCSMETIDGATFIKSGNTLKGQTSTIVHPHEIPTEPFKFGGGLENLLPVFGEEIKLYIYDMRDYGGKYVLVFSDGHALVLQVGVPNEV